ncbi:hypothetical protein HK102_007647, partial [Quaeritorhiza haematococci]
MIRKCWLQNSAQLLSAGRRCSCGSSSGTNTTSDSVSKKQRQDAGGNGIGIGIPVKVRSRSGSSSASSTSSWGRRCSFGRKRKKSKEVQEQDEGAAASMEAECSTTTARSSKEDLMVVDESEGWTTEKDGKTSESGYSFSSSLRRRKTADGEKVARRSSWFDSRDRITLPSLFPMLHTSSPVTTEPESEVEGRIGVEVPKNGSKSGDERKVRKSVPAPEARRLSMEKPVAGTPCNCLNEEHKKMINLIDEKFPVNIEFLWDLLFGGSQREDSHGDGEDEGSTRQHETESTPKNSKQEPAPRSSKDRVSTPPSRTGFIQWFMEVKKGCRDVRTFPWVPPDADTYSDNDTYNDGSSIPFSEVGPGWSRKIEYTVFLGPISTRTYVREEVVAKTARS